MQNKLKGQSIVELAITAPILILMLLGVFEVGWAIRSYMIVATASREGARFITKPENFHLMEANPKTIGFTNAVSHTLINLKQLYEYEERSDVVISAFEYPATWPCNPDLREEPTSEDAWPNCDCLNDNWIPENIEIGMNPDLYPRLTYSWRGTPSELDFSEYYERRYESHLKATCSLVKTNNDTYPNNEVEIVVEVFYTHKQLLGFPVFTLFVPEEFLFRVPTHMRYVQDRDNASKNQGYTNISSRKR